MESERQYVSSVLATFASLLSPSPPVTSPLEDSGPMSSSPPGVVTRVYRHEPYSPFVQHSQVNGDKGTEKMMLGVLECTPLPALFHIRFKHTTRLLVGTHKTVIGSYVIVKSDQGCDIGIVEGIAGNCVGNTSSYHGVLRYATSAEVSQLEEQRRMEARYLEFVKLRVAECYMTSMMNVKSLEYQFDMSKVTVYFEPLTKKAVDFRHLQRVLFRDFRCRIWLQTTEKKYRQ